MNGGNRMGDEGIIISLADLVKVCRRAKWSILKCALICSLLVVSYKLEGPTLYEIRASFKEKENSNVGVVGESLFGMFSRGGGGNQGGRAIIKSRKLMETVAKKLKAQISISKKGEGRGLLGRAWDNIIVDRAYSKGRQSIVVPDITTALLCQEVTYTGEVPFGLTLRFTSEDTFVVSEGPKKVLGEGKLGEKFACDDYSFILVRGETPALAQQEFHISLTPLVKAAEGLAGSLQVKADDEDKTILRLSCLDRDRHKGTVFLNVVMEEYKNHLQEEGRKVTATQLGYLKIRQKETRDSLEKLMLEHAEALASDITASGFADSEKQMEFLARSQLEAKQRLLGINLELRRLHGLQEGDEVVLYDRYGSSGDPEIINTILNGMRTLRQQRDSLELALRTHVTSDQGQLERVFDEQLDDLSEIQQAQAEASSILATLESEPEFTISSLQLLDRPHLLVSLWLRKINETQGTFHQARGAEKALKKVQLDAQKGQFASYLKNLVRTFDVYQKILEERLSHQQNPYVEFQGIDIATAGNLYLAYNRQLDEVQNQIRQSLFIVEQIQDPACEMSSLSSVLFDPVSQGIVSSMSKLMLDSRDELNHSVREQERIKAEISLQKGFLASHLRQTAQLLGLKEGLTRDKIKALQSVTLDLIHQQLTLSEKNLSDYLTTRTENLKHEQQVIGEHLAEIHQQMAVLPRKWVTENLLKEHVLTGQRVVQETTRLVETKNLTSNLELVQSCPVDIAYPPLLPKQPKLLNFAVLGVILGAFGMTAFALVRALLQGLGASADNIALMGRHISGELSSRCGSDVSFLRDEDLNTLRRLSSFVMEQKGTAGQSLLLLQGQGSDYTHHLALLLIKKQLKVLVVSASFEGAAEVSQLPGLLQSLEGSATEPKVVPGAGYDTVFAGGASRYASELLSTNTFQALLANFRQKYDWVLLVSHAPLNSAEAETILALTDNTAVTVTIEPLDSLRAYTQGKESNKKITFLFQEKSS